MIACPECECVHHIVMGYTHRLLPVTGWAKLKARCGIGTERTGVVIRCAACRLPWYVTQDGIKRVNPRELVDAVARELRDKGKGGRGGEDARERDGIMPWQRD